MTSPNVSVTDMSNITTLSTFTTQSLLTHTIFTLDILFILSLDKISLLTQKNKQVLKPHIRELQLLN